MLRFDILLERTGGQLKGRMALRAEEDGRVTGYLTVSDHQEAFRGRVLRKNHFITALKFQSDDAAEDCDALLLVREDGTLTGVLLSAAAVWTLRGSMREDDAWEA